MSLSVLLENPLFDARHPLVHFYSTWQPLLFSHGLKTMASGLAGAIFEQNANLKF